MKKIMPQVAAVFFALFGAGVIALLMSYTFEALAYVFPDNFVSQMMGMVLFDIAALAWLGAFIYLAKSIMQYAFAFIGFLFGLLGSLAMVAIDVMLGGQSMVTPPEWINSALIYGFLAAAVVHVILTYAYKLAGPEISADISLGIESANITEEAMKQAENELLRERGALGRTIAPRLMNNVKRNLGLPVSGDVIDLPAYDVPDQSKAIPVHIPAARPMSFIERLKAVGKVLSNPAPISSAPLRYEANTKASAPIDSATVTSNPASPVIGSVWEHGGPGAMDIPAPIKDTPSTSAAPQADKITPPEELHYHPMTKLQPMDAKQVKTVQDVIAAGLCDCPPAFFARQYLTKDETAKFASGYPAFCWDTYAEVKHNVNASAAETCAACGFFKGDRSFTEAPK